MNAIRVRLQEYRSKSDLERQVKELADMYLEALDVSLPSTLLPCYSVEHVEVVGVEASLRRMVIRYEVVFSVSESTDEIYPIETSTREVIASVEDSTLILGAVA